MSREYAESRIREALKLCRGNATRARQQVIAWTFEDPKLLQALARPHLSGIVAHAVGRVLTKGSGDNAEAEEMPSTPPPLDMSPSSFGKEILAALTSKNTAMFGHETEVPPVRKRQASQRHVNALKQMSTKGAPPKKDGEA
jgi:hypothetical protein